MTSFIETHVRLRLRKEFTLRVHMECTSSALKSPSENRLILSWTHVTTNFSHPEKLKTSFLHIFVRHVISLSSIYAAWEMKFIRNCLLELLDDTLIHFISLLQCLIFGWILWGWWVLMHAQLLFEVTEFVFNYCNSQVSWQHHWPHAFIQT